MQRLKRQSEKIMIAEILFFLLQIRHDNVTLAPQNKISTSASKQ
jgi:hypothetical protein